MDKEQIFTFIDSPSTIATFYNDLKKGELEAIVFFKEGSGFKFYDREILDFLSTTTEKEREELKILSTIKSLKEQLVILENKLSALHDPR